MPDVGKFIEVADLADVEARVVVGEVLGLARGLYKLRAICDVIPMKDLIGDIPIATKLVGRKNVKELQEATLSSQAYTYTHFDLAAYGKNVVHVAISKEAQLKKTIVGNILQRNVKDAAKELAKMENEQVATSLATVTVTQVGTDWGDDTKDPSKDIEKAKATLTALDKGYEADTIALGPLAYADLRTNAFVRKQFERGDLINKGIPEYCELKVMKDIAITPATAAYILDSKAPALALGDGPSLVAEYSGNAAFYDGYAIAKFLEPKVVLNDAAIKITGVHA